MRRNRIIPTLLLKNHGFVKTKQFKDLVYLGDPINILKIFNEKEVDEIIILDIEASLRGRNPDIDYIRELASECFMPLAYGGGLTSIEQAKSILRGGVEKVIFNTSAFRSPELICGASRQFGSQSVVVSVDVYRNWLGNYKVKVLSGTKNTGEDPVTYAKRMVELGAGEIFINSIDRDGTYKGYDLELIRSVAESVNVPVIACGGARNVSDLARVISEGKASAASAGSMFVFHGATRGILINFPEPSELAEINLDCI